MLSDPLGMLEDLGREGVFFLRHIPRLFQEWQINIGLDVALRAWIAVPVPSPTEIPGLLDNTDIGDTDRLQPRCGEESTKAAAHDQRVQVLVKRRPREARLHAEICLEAL